MLNHHKLMPHPLLNAHIFDIERKKKSTNTLALEIGLLL
jgi:hypothetical protein